ncbi:MAG: sulfatase, partial [Planctomycetota bacterium]
KARGPAFEAADVADEKYPDGMVAARAIAELRKLAGSGKPFFLATGFMKPHLPFNAPKRYWDMYERDKIDLADNPFKPKDAPSAAIHNWGELRSYAGIPKKGPVSKGLERSLVHGYYACVTQTDAQIGKVLAELDRLGLRGNTVVVLWGDHGWNLNEHGLWCKHCNFDTSLHAPLIVSAPRVGKGVETRALTEFVDIYPSLCELAGLPLPEHLQGTSFVPLMKDPDRPWKRAIFSRYFRGESVRTDRHLYTEWKRGDKRYARMLYDHERDPKENVNISERPGNAQLVGRLARMLEAGWKAALPRAE